MNAEVVTEITRRAMATEFGVVLPGESRDAVEAAIDALAELERIESELSVYRPDSDVSRINSLAGIRPVRVSVDLIHVLQRAVAIFQLTAGAFDVTAGPLVDCWGFRKRRGQKPSDAEISSALELVGSDRLRIDPEEQSAFLPQAGMSINLGGIGKGFALDRIADRLKENGLSSFLIHGGRSSVLACGSDGPTAAEGWKVAIEHPLRASQRLGEIRLVDSALATSGSGKQFFHHRGQRLGHVLDPRLGRPAGDMLAITVIADRAADADALSTACFVEGIAATTAHLTRDSSQTRLPGPDWPTAAVAVLEGQRQAEVQLELLGATQQLRFVPSEQAPRL